MATDALMMATFGIFCVDVDVSSKERPKYRVRIIEPEPMTARKNSPQRL